MKRNARGEDEEKEVKKSQSQISKTHTQKQIKNVCGNQNFVMQEKKKKQKTTQQKETRKVRKGKNKQRTARNFARQICSCKGAHKGKQRKEVWRQRNIEQNGDKERKKKKRESPRQKKKISVRTQVRRGAATGPN